MKSSRRVLKVKLWTPWHHQLALGVFGTETCGHQHWAVPIAPLLPSTRHGFGWFLDSQSLQLCPLPDLRWLEHPGKGCAQGGWFAATWVVSPACRRPT